MPEFVSNGGDWTPKAEAPTVTANAEKAVSKEEIKAKAVAKVKENIFKMKKK